MGAQSDAAVRSVAVAIHDRRNERGTPYPGTVVAPGYVITLGRLVGDRFPVASADGKSTTGTIIASPFEIMALLKLDHEFPSLEPVQFVSGAHEFQSLWPGTANEICVGKLYASPTRSVARLEGRDDAPQNVIGAPIVVDGRLAGVLGGLMKADEWDVIPALRIADVIATLNNLTPPSFDQLAGSAKRALTHAFASASGREVHTEHLVTGLYENPEGSLRRMLDARGVSETALQRVIVETSETKQLFPGEYAPPTPLDKFPPTSAHVTEALAVAARTATEHGESHIRARHVLFGLLSIQCAVRNALESLGLRASDIQMQDATRISGFVSDVADGEDLLGVQAEAKALATVLGAEKVKPPIAVGLLGTWGSGKSFFMHEMERQFAAIEQRGRDGDAECCSNIIQIWFNAWHYIDSNLWASLTSEIFDALDAELNRRGGGVTDDDPAQQRAQLLAEQCAAQAKVEKAKAERELAEKEQAEIAEGRRKLADENYVAARVELLTIGDAVASDNAEVRDARQAAVQATSEFAAKFGVDRNAIESLHGFGGKVRAFVLAVRKSGPATWKLMFALIALSLVVGAAAIAAQNLLQEVAQWLTVASVAGAIGTFVQLVRTYGPDASDLLAKLERLGKLKDRLIQEERASALAQLDARDKQAAAALAQAAQREEDESRKVRATQQKLVELQPTQKMKSYVRERRESTDYTKHLGIIAKAHDDFDRLSRYLATATTSDERRVVRPLVDRIVLYIDDLDRCPESKVVEVLQAVHLLLAFPLFVVVVGVDSRWLLHSLKSQMRQFRADDANDDADALDRTLWESTPINYLEKIFQIPFTLRPMQPTRFADLIDDLTRPADTRVASANTAASPQLEPTSTTSDTAASAAPQPSSAPQATASATERQPRTGSASDAAPSAAFTSTAHLTFTDAEVRYMKELYDLMPSPRGAKRFVNLYRIMRGMLDEYRLQAYVDEASNEHQAALLLLAMLIGFPEETTEILQRLLVQSQAGGAIVSPWWTFVTDVIETKTVAATADASRERWEALGAKLARIRKQVKKPDEHRSCEHFVAWADDVARFSFYSGQIVSDYRAASVAQPVTDMAIRVSEAAAPSSPRP